MTYKEFCSWCNQRACDGYWGMSVAIACIDIMNVVKKQRFWRREKFWKENYEKVVLKTIVDPIEEKIQKLHLRSGGTR